MPRTDARLAINGGPPARERPDPPLFPGGAAIAVEEEQAVLEVLRAKRLFRFYGLNDGASKVAQLEGAFAEMLGVRHALAVTSGTAALMCGLQGIGVGPGDEVIVPAFTWIASATAVMAVGGIPVIAEIDASLTLDPEDVERKISPHTKAIMPVHMRGAPARMDALLDLARRHGLRVIEDCAQANGASFRGARLGSLGDVGCFSLQFSKIITTGEGGLVATNSREVYHRAFMWHDVSAWEQLGIPEEEVLWGTNFRMPEMPAAIGLVQLQRLPGLVERLRVRQRTLMAGIQEAAQRKDVSFRDTPDPEGDSGLHVVLLFPGAEEARWAVDALHAENIRAGLAYRPDRRDLHVYAHWFPVLEQRTWTPDGGPWRWARREIAYTADMCPRSLDLLGRAVFLDVHPGLTNEELEETIEGVNKVLDAL